jgi:hypothetical protein
VSLVDVKFSNDCTLMPYVLRITANVSILSRPVLPASASLIAYLISFKFICSCYVMWSLSFVCYGFLICVEVRPTEPVFNLYWPRVAPNRAVISADFLRRILIT